MFIMNVMDNDRQRHNAAALRAAGQVLAEICDSLRKEGAAELQQKYAGNKSVKARTPMIKDCC